MLHITLPRCSDCGSLASTVMCLKTRRDICRSCCDVDCKNQYSCWGRFI